MVIKSLCEIFIHVARSLMKLPNWKDCSLFALNEIIWLISFELIGILTKEIVLLLQLTVIGVGFLIGLVFSCSLILFDMVLDPFCEVIHLISLILRYWIGNATKKSTFVFGFHYLSIYFL